MKRVLIVGRPNVGKSALFNRLAGRKIAIVHDQPGVTRDRLVAICRLGQEPFEVVDTGGIGCPADPEFAEVVEMGVEAAIATSDVIVFVVDAKEGLVPTDEELARRLRSATKPVLLAVNKVDTPEKEPMAWDFSNLGLPLYPISAAHGHGVGQLVEAIEARLPADGKEEIKEKSLQKSVKIAIVGRPNVGKSSLTNALVGEERAIVSEIPGTTRDLVEVPFEFGGKDYVLCDTAGLRHRSKHRTSVEVFSAMRTESAIRSANLCILLVDATQGVTAQDKKIAQLVVNLEKAVVVALNKWDVAKGAATEKIKLDTHIGKARAELFFLSWAPFVAISAKKQTGLRRLFQQIERVEKAAQVRIGTGELNRLLQQSLEAYPPPMHKGKRFKIYYAAQVFPETPGPFAPPEVVMFVNQSQLLLPAYREYLLRQIRSRWEFLGLPIRLRLRSKNSEKN